MTDTDSWLTPSRRRLLSGLGAGGVAALAGCSGRSDGGDGGDTTTSEGADGDGGPTTVRIGIAQGGWDLIPARDTDFVSNLVYTLVYDNVVNLNPAAEVVPELATDYTKESDTQYVFDLREGVTFHNGEPFTAGDVEYTYDWIQNEENPRKNYLAQVESVVVEDDTTVRFDLSQPYAPFLYKVHAVMWPLSRTAVEAADEEYNQQPVGTGPFTFDSWDSGNRAVLSAYEDYWNGAPAIDEVEFRILPEASSKVTQLETGDVDIVDTVPAPFAGRIQGADDVELIQTPGVSSGRVDFNTDVDGLGERQVRRALTWAIDKQQIVDTVFTGFADPARSVLPNSFPGYAEEISDFNHPTGDTERARQLLADAGYGDLSLEIKTSTRSEHRRAATLIQSMWSEIGVDASVKSLDGNTFFNQELEGDYEVAVSNWTWLGDPDTLLYLYHSEGLNVWNIADDELDAMLEEQRRVTGDRRQQLVRDIQQYVYEEAFSAYTYYPRRLQGISADIEGFEQYPNGSFRSLDGAGVD